MKPKYYVYLVVGATGFFVGAKGFLVGFLLGEATVGATGALIRQAFALLDHMP